MRVGQARKRDANEAAIVKALRGIGTTVRRLNEPGLPDLLVWHRREGLCLIEVKIPGGTLTPGQKALRHVMPFLVVENEAEALAHFGITV